MRKTLSFMGVAALLVIQASVVWALTQTATFQLNATVPLATGINIIASAVNSATTVYTPASSPLSFNPLTLQTSGTYSWFEPNHYFAIFVAPTGGAGNPDVTANYTEGTSPSTTVFLGHRSNIAFVRVAANGAESTITAKQSLHNLVATPAHILPAWIGPGYYLKIYVGLNDGLAGFTPFTLADPAGTYYGTLVITAVI